MRLLFTLAALIATAGMSPAADPVLAALNAKRVERGLPAFIEDPALTAAAQRVAAFRARNRIPGHTGNDFGFLDGATADAAGCGALEPSWGFRTCCQWEHWQFAGAASVPGPDGRIYHHLFVRGVGGLPQAMPQRTVTRSTSRTRFRW